MGQQPNKAYPHATAAIRRLIKREILCLGYDLAANIFGYDSFGTHIANAGSFPRAISQIEHFGKHSVVDVHHTTAEMMQALTMPKFMKMYKKYSLTREAGTKVLEMYNVGKSIRKWGGVYKRIWAVKKRIERKGKRVQIKVEVDDDVLLAT